MNQLTTISIFWFLIPTTTAKTTRSSSPETTAAFLALRTQRAWPLPGQKLSAIRTPSQVGWKGLNNSFVTTQFYYGAVYPGGSVYFGGSQDNGTSRGTDYGTINQWSYLSGGDGGDVAVDPLDANTLYSEYANVSGLSLIKSIDGGVTNFAATNGITEEAKKLSVHSLLYGRSVRFFASLCRRKHSLADFGR